jgi:AcrR family transcriptional regulator
MMTLPRSGPVRSEAARQSILQATADLLAERGYDHLTIEAIAARAGVGKQTIYRWWKAKSQIIAESLLEGKILPDRLEPPDTGDLRRDLAAWMTAIAEVLGDERGEVIVRSLIAASAESADIGRRLRDTLLGSTAIVGRLRDAVGSEPHLQPGVPVGEVAEMLVGTLLLRAVSRSPLDADAIARILTAVLGPRVSAPEEGRSSRAR